MEDEILENAVPANPAAAGQNAFHGATGTAAPAPQPQVQVPHAVQPPTPGQPQMPNGKQLLQLITQLGVQQLGDKEFQKAFPQLAGLAPAPLMGPDVIAKISPAGTVSRGGILGTGMEPIDVLAFAFGAAITGNLPQDQAMAATFKIAGLPSAFRENQRKAAASFIEDQMKAVKLEVDQVNAETARTNAIGTQLATMKEAQKMQWLNGMEERLRSNTPLTEVEKRVGMMRAKEFGISDSAAKELFMSNDIAAQLALVEQVKTDSPGMSVSSTIDGPGGQKITVSDPRQSSGVNAYDARASALFGKRFYDLSPPQQQAVVAAVERVQQAQINIRRDNQDFTQENQLMDDYNTQMKGYKEFNAQYNKLRVDMKDKTGASDTAILFGYMKMLDRLSVVRESEQQQVKDLASYKDKAMQMYNNITTGKVRVLPDQVRNDIFNLTKKWHAEEAKAAEAIAKTYQRRAARHGVDGELFRFDGNTTPAVPAPPADFRRPGAPAPTSSAAPQLEQRNGRLVQPGFENGDPNKKEKKNG